MVSDLSKNQYIINKSTLTLLCTYILAYLLCLLFDNILKISRLDASSLKDLKGLKKKNKKSMETGVNRSQTLQ